MRNVRLDHLVADLAMTQAGVFTCEQAEKLGASKACREQRVANESWLPQADGVYLLRGHRLTFRARLWVAVLACGDGAVVSHEAAAALHGLATFGAERVCVTVRHAKTRVIGSAEIHQSRRLYGEHVTEVDGLPVTTVARTIIDLAAHYRRGRLEIALDNALAARRVTLDLMCATFDDLASRGRKGTRLMRTLLADRAPGYVAPASVLESLFLRLLRNGGLPRPVLQFPHPNPAFEGMFVDAAYPERRILIELDSRRWHDRSRDHERDRERDVAALNVRWKPYRYTYRQVTEQGDWVLDTIRQARRIAA